MRRKAYLFARVYLLDQPLHALLQTLAGASRARQDLPGSISEVVETQFRGEFCRRQGVQQVLLVGHQQHRDVRQLLLVQKLLQLDARLFHATTVSRVDDVNQSVRLVVVVSPVRTDRLLSCKQQTAAHDSNQIRRGLTSDALCMTQSSTISYLRYPTRSIWSHRASKTWYWNLGWAWFE